jgi:hypothetical protein
LEGLAKISPFSTMAFDRTLHLGTARIAWGSTVVVITSLLPENITAQLAHLLARGHRVVLIAVGDEIEAPQLRGLVVRRVAGVARDEAETTTDVPEGNHNLVGSGLRTRAR